MTRLFHVPKPPLNYLPRPDQLGPLVELLLSQQPQAVGVVGVQGMGGIGKSVLAVAAANEPQVQEEFPDGIYWLTVGQSPDMVAIQRQLAHDLGVPLNEIQFLDAALGRSELENRLAGKAVLLVLDDVWQMEHAEQLNVVSPPGRVLITTRNQSVLQGLGAAMHRVDLLSLDESLELLGDWAGQKRQTLPPEAAEVARECGYLPLALAIVGALIQRRPTAWPDALARLRQHDLAKLQTRFPGYPHPNLLRAMEVSVDALDDDWLARLFGRDVRQRYLELAVFPEDEPIPEAALAVLWGAAGLDEADVRELMDEFVARSLAQGAMGSGVVFGQRTNQEATTLADNDSRPLQPALRLHDLQVDYLLAVCGDLPALHGRFVDAYDASFPGGLATGADDGYYFQHLPDHLAQANRRAELCRLLRNAGWLQAHLAATNTAALIRAFRWIEQEDTSSSHARRDNGVFHLPWENVGARRVGRVRRRQSGPLDCLVHDLRMLRDAIRLSAHVLTNDPTQLASQLLGRLDGNEFPTLRPLLRQFGRADRKSLLRPLTCSLNPPGIALLRTLQGHSAEVCAVAVTPDGGYAVSASNDKTLCVWDLDTGTIVRTLRGHTSRVNGVAVTPDGRCAISASNDETLCVWDLDTGTIVRTLRGHTSRVNRVAVTRDGRYVISASGDRTLRVWDLNTGTTVRTLQGHSSGANAVAVTPDGRSAISSCGDGTLLVWDLDTGQTVRALPGDSRGCQGVAVTPDGQYALSASFEGELLNLGTGRTVCTLQKSWGWGAVTAVAVTPDGRYAIFAFSDRTLRVWDSDMDHTVRTAKRHWGMDFEVAVTQASRHVISMRVLRGHASQVNAVAVTPDSRHAISASDDRTLRVWDLHTDQKVRQPPGHSGVVRAVAMTPDGRHAVSASDDHTLRVWDVGTGKKVRTLSGHRGEVNAVAVTPDGGRAISASGDKKLRVWELAKAKTRHILKGHSGSVRAVAVTPDGGYAISASDDQTLRVWNLDTGQTVRTLQGHSDRVSAVAVAPNGEHAISASLDQTLRVWDLHTGQTLAVFTGESGLECCAVGRDGVTIVAGESLGRVHFLRLVEPRPGQRRKKRMTNLKSEIGDSKRVKKPRRDQVFISYSHEDQVWLQRLQKHLKPCVRNATISVWDDTQIKAGTKWRDEIAAALAAARVGVLLVSPNFLASDFIADKELPPLLEAAQKDGLTVVWVPISASAFKKTPIADFQAAHDPATPLDSLSEAQQNKALVEICEKIEAAYSGS